MLRIKSITPAGVILLAASLAWAQGPRSRKGMRMYDSATETTIKGTVEDVKEPGRGHMMGMHLIVKADDKSTEVMLGPSTFINDKGFCFAKGDSIEVTGSRITMGETEYVIAREVVKGGKKLTLRDKDGRPRWAGPSRRRG